MALAGDYRTFHTKAAPLRRLGLLLPLLLVLPLLRPAASEPASVPSAVPAPAPVIIPSASKTVPAAETADVRMRKLHLVRPDLIAYPLAYDVYC